MQVRREQRGTLITYLGLMAAVLIPFFRMIAPYAMALLMGLILATLCYPAYKLLVDRRWSPRKASGLVTLGLLVLVLGPVTLFTITAVRQTAAVVTSLTSRGVLTFENITSYLLTVRPIRYLLEDPEAIQTQLRTTISNAAQALSGIALNLAAQIPELLLQMVLGLFASFFFLADGKRFFQWASDKVPLSRDIRLMLYNSFRNTANSVILASVAAAGVQSAIMVLAFLILSVPGAFLAGGATFIFAWIPILGSVPVWGAGAIYLYLEGHLVKMVFMLIFGLVTSLSDNVVRPLILGGRDEMHPLVALIAIFGGIAMFGIFGVLIGPILAALVIAILDTWPSVARQFGINVGDDAGEIIATSHPTEGGLEGGARGPHILFEGDTTPGER